MAHRESAGVERMHCLEVILLCSVHSQHCGKTANMVGGNLGQVGLPGIVLCL